MFIVSFLTIDVSLGVLSPQGRHSITHTEHMPLKEPYRAMFQPGCLEKLPYRPQQQGLCTAPMFCLLAFSELVLKKSGHNPDSST